MSCPYRTHTQFANWLVKYKGWKRIDTKSLTTHEMRLMYHNGTPNLKKQKNLPAVYTRDIMDFDEACIWYQEQMLKESKERL